MAFLEALLGGIAGAAKGGGDLLQKQALAEETAKAQEAARRQRFQDDVLKGIIVQSVKPKGQKFDFGTGLDDRIGTEISSILASGRPKGGRRGGGGGNVQSFRSRSRRPGRGRKVIKIKR
jgi:hypothetical protein